MRTLRSRQLKAAISRFVPGRARSSPLYSWTWMFPICSVDPSPLTGPSTGGPSGPSVRPRPRTAHRRQRTRNATPTSGGTNPGTARAPPPPESSTRPVSHSTSRRPAMTGAMTVVALLGGRAVAGTAWSARWRSGRLDQRLALAPGPSPRRGRHQEEDTDPPAHADGFYRGPTDCSRMRSAEGLDGPRSAAVMRDRS